MATSKELMLKRLMEEYGNSISRYTNDSNRPPPPRDMITTVTIGTMEDLKKFKKLVSEIVVEGKFTEDNMQKMRELVAEQVVSKL